jgi:hypothetical protein
MRITLPRRRRALAIGRTEIFINGAKVSTAVETNAQGATIAASWALQHLVETVAGRDSRYRPYVLI